MRWANKPIARFGTFHRVEALLDELYDNLRFRRPPPFAEILEGFVLILLHLRLKKGYAVINRLLIIALFRMFLLLAHRFFRINRLLIIALFRTFLLLAHRFFRHVGVRCGLRSWLVVLLSSAGSH